MKTSKFQNRILFARVRSKDKQAFIKAYDLYIGQIYRFIYLKVGDKETAEDLTSEVFLKTWNYINDGNSIIEKTLRALIYKIARNAIIDHYRQASYQADVSIDKNEIDLADDSQDTKKQIEISDDIAIIEAQLQKLKDEYREIIILRFVNELSITEIANILNKSKGNVRVLTHRALSALRGMMDNEF